MQFILICNKYLRLIRICIFVAPGLYGFPSRPKQRGVSRSMYVCLCNGLTTRAIRAVAATCSSTGGVYRALGVEPRCGKCIPTIRGMVAAAKEETREELASGAVSG
jgi:bacterioferritin-associated ferredoxin